PAGGPMPGGIPPPGPGILPGTGPPLNTGSVADGDALAAGEGPEPAVTSGGTGGMVGVRTDRPPAGEPPPEPPGGSPAPSGGCPPPSSGPTSPVGSQDSGDRMRDW